MTIRLDPAMRRGLNRLAQATARSRAWLAQEAIRAYLELHRWQVEAIEEGVRAADAGRWMAHEDVAAWLDTWGSRREKAPPK